ncbi:Two component transcriptional regulator, LuxR family [Verrucomicrobia bacterium]|nr:Two component transcriptional regulator, LuxR family [Verrucomicrobiota bacterium]
MTKPENIRIAVVEDKAAFRRGLGAIFELTPGIECVGMYATGEEALRELPRSAPEVVLMDINLPGMSGIECTRELKRLRPATQVVMLTIEENTDRVFAALRSGAAGYLLKAAPPQEILEGIQLVAQGGSPMSAVIARRVVESFHGAPGASGSKESLTQREVEVLEGIARGKRVKEVAADLGVSPTTVQTYLRRIYEKLQVHSQAEAVAKLLS